MSEQKVQTNKIVLVEGQLEKIIHEEGEGEKPSKGQQVLALYRGTLENGTEFDSNQDRNSPFKFTLGQGMVIKGWDQGFASMKRGEKATLICSPDYAYGQRGSPPRIPPNSTLHFEVELIDFIEKPKQKFDMSPEEKVEEAKKLKQEGNAALKEGKFKEAVRKYQSGIQFVDNEEQVEAQNILKILRLNISQAFLKTKQYSSAIQNCDKVLKQDAKNVKGLYRRGLAYLNNQDFSKAKDDFNAILEVDPQNAEAKKQLVNVSQMIKKAYAKEKKVFGGMFSQGNIYEDKKIEEKKEGQEQKDENEDEKAEQQQAEQEMPKLEKDETEQKKEEIKQ